MSYNISLFHCWFTKTKREREKPTVPDKQNINSPIKCVHVWRAEDLLFLINRTSIPPASVCMFGGPRRGVGVGRRAGNACHHPPSELASSSSNRSCSFISLTLSLLFFLFFYVILLYRFPFSFIHLFFYVSMLLCCNFPSCFHFSSSSHFFILPLFFFLYLFLFPSPSYI